QVVEQLAALADHLEQATTRVVVLAVLLEVAGKSVDASGEQRDLNFGGAGVALGALEIGDDFRLGCVIESHVSFTREFCQSEAGDYTHTPAGNSNIIMRPRGRPTLSGGGGDQPPGRQPAILLPYGQSEEAVRAISPHQRSAR